MYTTSRMWSMASCMRLSLVPLLALLLVSLYFTELLTVTPWAYSLEPPPPFFRANTTRVVVAVFCCRRDFLEILDSYLVGNLKSNGGIVDEVVWIYTDRYNEGKNTWRRVQEISQQTPEYELVDLRGTENFSKMYGPLDDPTTVYIKLDDDIVYIAPGALSNLVEAYWANREQHCLFSANVVNHPRLSHFHQLAGAIEQLEPVDPNNLRVPFRRPSNAPQPYSRTFENDPFGECSWISGECAMMAHENFLRLAYSNQTSIYNGRAANQPRLLDLGPTDSPNYPNDTHVRWSINAMLLTKSLMHSMSLYTRKYQGKKITDDEHHISRYWTGLMDCSSVAVMDSLVVHFAYSTQNDYLMTNTDLLQRYRQLAMKLVGDPRGWLKEYASAQEAWDI